MKKELAPSSDPGSDLVTRKSWLGDFGSRSAQLAIATSGTPVGTLGCDFTMGSVRLVMQPLRHAKDPSSDPAITSKVIAILGRKHDEGYDRQSPPVSSLQATYALDIAGQKCGNSALNQIGRNDGIAPYAPAGEGTGFLKAGRITMSHALQSLLIRGQVGSRRLGVSVVWRSKVSHDLAIVAGKFWDRKQGFPCSCV